MKKKRKYYPERHRARHERVVYRNRTFIKEYLSTHPCVDCGETQWEILEFDHTIGEKKNCVSKMVYSASIKSLEEEIYKCEVRCCNCHRLKTHRQFNGYRNENHADTAASVPRPQLLCGSTVGTSKLTEDQVISIRAEYVPKVVGLVALGKKYGVSEGAIWRIVNNISWTHILTNGFDAHKKENAKKIKARMKEKAHNLIKNYLKTHPCVDCDESRWEVLEFDHVSGEKQDDVSYLVGRSAATSTILLEIEKCEVRCVNCHRLKTIKQFAWHTQEGLLNPTPPLSTRRGEEVSLSKLTEEQVVSIRAEYKPGEVGYYVLAKKYGVSHSTIRRVIIRECWKHI